MTPFGREIRKMRSERGVTLSDMAKALQVSPAYLSALELGKRGKPSKPMVYQICSYFNIIWDDAEKIQKLAAISRPRVVVDTGDLTPDATLLANLLADRIHTLSEDKIIFLIECLSSKKEHKPEESPH
tara:strand:+ start:3485 stop:3868 length:384 start_codon:yes stop_codon:yes gene_type:complete